MRIPVSILVCVMVLGGCRTLPAPGHTTKLPDGEPQGDGGTIVGTVAKVDEDGNLVTNIPFRWMATKRTDKDPLRGDQVPLERQPLLISIGSREFTGDFACDKESPGPGKWVVIAVPGDGKVHSQRDLTTMLLRIDFNKGNAAKITGAFVGTAVRLTKIDEEP